MKKQLIFIIIILSGVLFTVLEGKNDTLSEEIPQIDESKLVSGDLILRRGKGMISDLFCNASLNKREYSHAGFLIKQDSDWLVIHMIGGSDGNGLRIEKLSDFINTNENRGYAVYRYDFMKNNIPKLELYLRKLKKEQPLFDDHFSMDTDNELYCSEMIFKAVNSIHTEQLPFTDINHMKYIAIDNLYPETCTSKIIEVTYTN